MSAKTEEELSKFYGYYESQPELALANEEETPKGEVVVGEKEDGINVITYHDYLMLQGRQYSVLPFDMLWERIHSGKSLIILIVGDPGEGKSWFGLMLAKLLDRRFSPEKQVVFDRPTFLKLISDTSPLRRHQCIIADEAQFTLSNQRWYENIQKDLTEQIEAIRFKQLIIIIVAIHQSMVSNVVRDRLINFTFTLEKRGEATMYKTIRSKFEKTRYPKRVARVILPVPDSEYCKSPNCLNCTYSGLLRGWKEGDPLCLTSRARYERMKKVAVQKESVEAQDRIEVTVAKKLSDVEIADRLLPFIAEVAIQKDKSMNVDSLCAVCSSKAGIEISRIRGYTIRQRIIEKVAKAGGV